MSNTTTSPALEADSNSAGNGHIRLLFAGLMVTMLLASLNQTVLSTALPTIVGELNGVDHMTWVITSYILASTITMPMYGKISDLLGRKPVLITAILLFMAGSVIGGLAPNIEWLIVGRVGQGLGGGGLIILSQAAIADVVPARERGKYMGIMGAVFAVASVAGPLLGGWFTEGPGWRWAFWINIPLGLLAIAAAVFFLRIPPTVRTEKPKSTTSAWRSSLRSRPRSCWSAPGAVLSTTGLRRRSSGWQSRRSCSVLSSCTPSRAPSSRSSRCISSRIATST